MRYAQGGGLTAEGRRRREQVRLEAARRFEQGVPAAAIAAELRVSERSVRRWRRAWQAAGEAGLASRGQAAQCRLDEQQLAALDAVLEAGPLAAGWEDQRWTLARVRNLVAGRFRVQYTVPGIWYLLQRRGWSCQIGARRAIERDDGAGEGWKKETWPRIKAPRLRCYRGRTGETKAFTWTEYRDLLTAAHRQLPGGVVVLVWDNLNVHRRAEWRAFTDAQAWLRVFRLPAYAPDLNPVEMSLPQC